MRAIVTMATSLGMQVTAEGVETSVQRDSLRAQGCARVRGHPVGGPGPASEVAAVICARRPAGIGPTRA